jgi:hypothetical protein
LKRPCVLQKMVLEDMIVRGLRATEKMTWLDAYGKPACRPVIGKRYLTGMSLEGARPLAQVASKSEFHVNDCPFSRDDLPRT